MEHKNEKAALRFVSYNIRKARGRDGRRDPRRILDVINARDADVVALQEADLRLGDRAAALPRDAIEAESDFQVLRVATNDLSMGWHGNAVLLRKGIKARDIRRIELPGLEPRGALRFTLDLPMEVTVLATHLGLRRKDRRRQLERLAGSVSAEPSAIILGDFNEWSLGRGMEPLLNRFEVAKPGRSFHSMRPLLALDRIAHTENLQLLNSGVANGSTERVASDHLPIWADIEGQIAPTNPSERVLVGS